MKAISENKEAKQLQPILQQDISREGFRTIEITHSNLGKKILEPIQVLIPKPKDEATKDLYDFIILSLRSKASSLIPFAFQNKSVINMVKSLKRYHSGSPSSAFMYIYSVSRYCKWLETEPDQLISECKDLGGNPINKVLNKHSRLLDEYIGCLQASKLASKTVSTYISAVKALYKSNKLKLELPEKPQLRITYNDRSPTPDELSLLMDIADLREKVIISCLALGSFREGTLSQMKYRHVKRDLEKGVVPIHVYVEAEITKGKYHDYDTFLGQEAAMYIQAYLEVRRRGSPKGYIPPETITDESPLIRDERSKTPKPITPGQIGDIIRHLYMKAGLIDKNPRLRRYRVRPHSIRKYFRTQLSALGVDRDYIEYMMGHTVSTYHDIQMKGVEFLRNMYAASELSIKPKTQLSKIDTLKEIIRAWGMNPDEILTRKALAQPHRTYTGPSERDEELVGELRNALKEMMRKELLDAKNV